MRFLGQPPQPVCAAAGRIRPQITAGLASKSPQTPGSAHLRTGYRKTEDQLVPHIHVNMVHAAQKAALSVLLGTAGSYTLLPPFRLAPAFRLFTGFDLPILLAAAQFQLHRHFDNACIDGVQSGEAGKGAADKSIYSLNKMSSNKRAGSSNPERDRCKTKRRKKRGPTRADGLKSALVEMRLTYQGMASPWKK